MSQANATLTHTEARRHLSGMNQADAMAHLESMALQLAAAARASASRPKLSRATAMQILALSDGVEELVAVRGW